MSFDLPVLDTRESVPNLHFNSDLSTSHAIGTVGDGNENLWAGDVANDFFSLCDKCACTNLTSLMKRGDELDATAYVSIIHCMQKKVCALQQALLASQKCSSLLETIEGTDRRSTTDVLLQKVRVSKEMCSAQKKCSERSETVKMNDTMAYLRHIASKAHMKDFNEWTKEATFNFLNKFNITHDKDDTSVLDIDNKGTKQQQEEQRVAVRPPSCVNDDGHMRMSLGIHFSADPIIVLDISSTVDKIKQCTSMTQQSVEASKTEEYVSKMERLTAENVKLREECSTMQCQLDIRDKEIQCQKIKLEELTTRVEQLQECNDRLKEDCAMAHSRYNAAVEMAHISETKLKEMTSTFELLEVQSRTLDERYTEAKSDAKDAWKEVHRLESEIRNWEKKERELRRLRLLLRFSELKKDSDKLSEMLGEMAAVHNERERLREENKRCRALLERYRDRLDAVFAHSSVSGTDSCYAMASIPDTDIAPVSPLLQPTVVKPHIDTPLPHKPRLPITGSKTVGKTGERFVSRVRQHCSGSKRRPESACVYNSKLGNVRSFDKKEDCSKRQTSLAATRSQSCNNRSPYNFTNTHSLLRSKELNLC